MLNGDDRYVVLTNLVNVTNYASASLVSLIGRALAFEVTETRSSSLVTFCGDNKKLKIIKSYIKCHKIETSFYTLQF